MKNLRFLALVLCLAFFAQNLISQSVLVDIESTDSGVLLPRMTTAEREAITNPVEGLIVYDITKRQLFLFNGSLWQTYQLALLPGPGNKPGFYGPTWSVFGNVNADEISDPPLMGNTDYLPLVFITNNLERLRITEDGVIKIVGDLNVGQNAIIGKDLTVKQDVFLNTEGGTTAINGPTTIGGPDMNTATFTGPVQMNKTLNVDGKTTLNEDLTVTGMKSTSLTGSLTVDKATTLNDDLTVTGMKSTHLSGTLAVDKVTTLNDDLTVTGMKSTHLTGTLAVDKATTLNDDLTVTGMKSTHLTGTIQVDKSLTVGNNSGSKLSFNPAVVNTPEDAFINYPLQLSGEGASQGMAIQLNSWQSDRNFIAFFAPDRTAPNAIQMRGRIEGKNAFLFDNIDNTSQSLMTYDPNEAKGVAGGDTTNQDKSAEAAAAGMTPIPTGGSNAANAEEVIELVFLAVELIAKVILVATSFASIPFDPVDIFDAAVELIIAIASLAVFIGFGLANIGVAYESGSGDYAEWLQKDNIEEVFNYGDVVGVTGGKISKTYEIADNFMVISAAPAVLGNMPQLDEEDNYETVAFMGQVPVKVRGPVHVGDYILPSGDEDGLAIAVPKDKMKAKDYQRIVGVAWEDWNEKEKNKIFQMINTAVGINQNDMAGMIEQMQMVMNKMQDAIREINPAYEGFVYETDSNERKMEADYTTSPTNRATMEQYFEGKEYSNREELGALVIEAIETQAGINLSEYPLVERMLREPEYAEAAKVHYSKLLNEYLAYMDELKKGK